jgi:O-antigen ligase
MKKTGQFKETITIFGYYLLLAFVFCLPLNKKILPYIISAIILNWLIGWRFHDNLKTCFKNKYLLLFIAFFLLHIIGILYSQNIYYALDDVLLKLSLFIFPFALFDSLSYSYDRIKTILTAFVIGCFIACIICLIHSLMVYSQKHDLMIFFYGELSIFHHPGYFSMYLNFVLALLIFVTFLKQNNHSKRYVFFSSTLIIFFILFIILLNSKTGILSSLLIILIALIYYFSNKRTGILVVTMLSILLFFFIAYQFLNKPVNPRFNKPMEMIQNRDALIEKKTTESTSVRILIWQAAIEIIKENYRYGVGTGDTKDMLLKKYKEKGMTGAYNEKLNAHNQFLQTFIALGLPGIILLLSSIIFPSILAFRKKNFIYLTFLIIIFINFLTESMLETIAGVMFYASFNSLLIVNVYRKELSLSKD